MSEALDVARRLVGVGISVLPVGADEQPITAMLPVVEDEDDPAYGQRSWKPLRHRLPTDDELVAWFARGEAAPARIHGGISGDCETIEINIASKQVWQGWLELVRAVKPDLPDRLTVIGTPWGGWDVFYRCSGPVEGSQKLAEAPEDEWEAEEVEVSAEEALNPTAATAKRDRVSEAAGWLRRQLAGGEWVKTAEMEDKLDAARISHATYAARRNSWEWSTPKNMGVVSG